MMMDSSPPPPPLLLGLGLGLEDRERSEIVFFDVETTVPSRTGQGFALLEFGAILVCPKNLEELESYSTLVRPSDISAVSVSSVRCNGITREAVSSAPPFQQIADKVYDILHGRVWAGHNIIRFDCARIREAFAAIGRPPPEPKGTIDSLALLTQRFGRRAGNMKMATLATYFGLGKQTHRSLDDVRMNLEVLKYCATVLFLESSLPDILTANGLDTPNAGMRTRSNRKHSDAGKELEIPSPFNMGMLIDTIKEPLEPDASMEGRSLPDTPVPAVNEGCSGYAGFLAPEEVSVDFLRASLVPSFRGGQRMQLMHKDLLLQLNCAKLRVRFGVSTKFLDHAGRPRLNIVLDVTPRLCQVLDVCDHLAQSLSVESGSSSEWKPVVFRKNGFMNLSTIRLHIPIIADGDDAIYSTDIYQKDASGTVHKLVFSKVDATQLESLLAPGTWLDVFFGLDVYDYQQNAGIRLVAKKLTICS